MLITLGISILRVGSNQGVKRFNGESWHTNSYIHGQMRQVAPEYRVSFMFDLMSRTAEEIAALIAKVTDSLFQSTHSQLEAPNFFFKAIMYGAASTIGDQDLNTPFAFTRRSALTDKRRSSGNERQKQTRWLFC